MQAGTTRARARPRAETFLLYREALSLIERLHRRLLDLVKDEFERLDIIEINPVQALILYNLGDSELTAGELRSRGCYQGSNVSYNLKKLVALGYLLHRRCEVDRRAVRVRLSPRGQEIRRIVTDLFARHAAGLEARRERLPAELLQVNEMLRQLDHFWAEQIRYIY